MPMNKPRVLPNNIFGHVVFAVLLLTSDVLKTFTLEEKKFFCALCNQWVFATGGHSVVQAIFIFSFQFWYAQCTTHVWIFFRQLSSGQVQTARQPWLSLALRQGRRFSITEPSTAIIAKYWTAACQSDPPL